MAGESGNVVKLTYGWHTLNITNLFLAYHKDDIGAFRPMGAWANPLSWLNIKPLDYTGCTC